MSLLIVTVTRRFPSSSASPKVTLDGVTDAEPIVTVIAEGDMVPSSALLRPLSFSVT